MAYCFFLTKVNQPAKLHHPALIYLCKFDKTKIIYENKKF